MCRDEKKILFSKYVPALSLIVSPRSAISITALPIVWKGSLKLPSPSKEAVGSTHQLGPPYFGTAETISENGPSKPKVSSALTTK